MAAIPLPARADAGQICLPILQWNLPRGQRQYTISGPHQVNFHEARVRTQNLVLLVQILSLARAADLVGRAEKLDHCDYFSAVALAYLDIALGRRPSLDFKDQ